MKTISIFSIVILLVFNVRAQAENNIAQAQKYMNSQQAGFEENKGQVTGQEAQRVKYTYKNQDLSVFLLNNGMAYQFNKTHYPEGYQHLDQFAEREEQEKMQALSKDIRVETYRMDVTLVGANLNPSISTDGKSQDYTQYYNHNALNVHSYSKITYHNVYPNIDWVIYTKEGKGLKYDFVVHPGGDPAQIKLQTTSVEDLTLNQDGSLTLKNRMGYITEQTPISFQGEHEIKTNFTIENKQITFNVASYNPTQTLIIDPNLLWGTYYGGSYYEYGYSCAVDGSGHVYLAGQTSSITSIAANGHQNTFGGDRDAFLVQFNSAGVRQWGTYYGGSGWDYGNSCAVDGSGHVYLAGETESTTDIAANGHQNTYGGFYDAFLVQFNSAGVRQWGTYYGGTSGDYGRSCSVDGSGNVYLAGHTGSNTSIASNGHQNTFGGGYYDAFLVQFNASGIRQWGTYYGGSLDDYGRSCAIDGSGYVYLTGKTESNTDIAANGHQNTYGGGDWDAFLVKFNSSGVRQWGTYYGGSTWDDGRFCDLDDSGNVYLAGITSSTSDITSNGHQNTYGGGGWDAFLVQFNSSGVRQWGTYYGGSGIDYGYSCAIDDSSHVYLAGQTSSTSNIAANGYQNTYGGGSYDAYLVKFNSAGVRQWGTYYGGVGYDEGRSCALDGFGNVYLSGSTSSYSGIAMNGHQNTYAGGTQDAFLTLSCMPTSLSFSASICAGDSFLFNSINITTAGAYIDTLINQAGCDSIIILNLSVNPLPALSITLNGDILEATTGYVSYQWSFNGTAITGSTSSTYTPIQNGMYEVIVTDVNGCDNSVIYNYISTNIKTLHPKNLVILYPNPASTELTIEMSSTPTIYRGFYQITDLQGRMVLQGMLEGAKTNINVAGLAKGVYVIDVSANNIHHKQEKLVVE